MASTPSEPIGGGITPSPRVRLRLVPTPDGVDRLPTHPSDIIPRPMAQGVRIAWLIAGILATAVAAGATYAAVFALTDGALWTWDAVWAPLPIAAIIAAWFGFISSWRGSRLKREFRNDYPDFQAKARAARGTVIARDLAVHNGRVSRLTVAIDYTLTGEPPARVSARMTSTVRTTVLHSDIPLEGSPVMVWVGPGDNPWVVAQFNKEWATARLPQRQAKAGAEEPEESRFVSELAELTQMLHRGDLTPEEYEDAKSQLLEE